MTGLFEIPAGDERTVTAMGVTLSQIASQGRVLSQTVRRALLDQAEAVDLARASRRATQISGANRVLAELLRDFGLLDAQAPPETDAFQAFVQAIEQAANGSPA